MLNRLVSPRYFGKLTCCHTQAMASAFFRGNDGDDLEAFEIYTTVPFGVIYIPNDSNRLLDSFLDPDLGIDRALETLKIPFRVFSWHNQDEYIDAMNCLYERLEVGPAVIGPLNMGKLPYYFHSELYNGIDHYLVALSHQNNLLYVCDPEGYILTYISEDEFVSAWSGDGIPEGRGKFIFRYASISEPPLFYTVENLVRNLSYICQNLMASQELEYGGGQAYYQIAMDAEQLIRDSSKRRGLTYAIPNRIQRCIFAKSFFATIADTIPKPAIQVRCTRIVELLDEQINYLGQALSVIMKKDYAVIKILTNVGDNENKITEDIVLLRHII